MDEFILNLDSQILLWVNSRHTPFLDILMYSISDRWVWVPLYLSMLYAIYLCYGVRAMILMALMTALAVTAADQICGSLLRPVVGRLRPANLMNPLSEYVHIVDGYRGGRFGFPSCHAANTFAVAVMTSIFFKRWRYTLFAVVWALLICYTRMYLGVHYPGDLIVGTVIGSVFGLACCMLMRILLTMYCEHRPHDKDARRMNATYLRGAPLITSHVFGRTVRWLPSRLPIYVGVLTIIVIVIYATVLT